MMHTTPVQLRFVCEYPWRISSKGERLFEEGRKMDRGRRRSARSNRSVSTINRPRRRHDLRLSLGRWGLLDLRHGWYFRNNPTLLSTLVEENGDVLRFLRLFFAFFVGMTSGSLARLWLRRGFLREGDFYLGPRKARIWESRSRQSSETDGSDEIDTLPIGSREFVGG